MAWKNVRMFALQRNASPLPFLALQLSCIAWEEEVYGCWVENQGLLMLQHYLSPGDENMFWKTHTPLNFGKRYRLRLKSIMGLKSARDCLWHRANHKVRRNRAERSLSGLHIEMSAYATFEPSWQRRSRRTAWLRLILRGATSALTGLFWSMKAARSWHREQKNRRVYLKKGCKCPTAKFDHKKQESHSTLFCWTKSCSIRVDIENSLKAW